MAEQRAEPAIVVEGLHEVFRIYKERPPGLKERLYRFRRAHYTAFHALDGVSLAIRHGECVGLVGHNGSGKSTLLKCMARILPADRGTVAVNGRVATLLELGAGFHQDLSGRENVYLNGALLGLTRDEIDAAFDSIVDFAGVRDFIDTPVRNYSSGMYVRLGFAIAVHVDPDILLVDEVLSVGDSAFQEKSLARMRSFKERGKTVVLVSHDLAAVRSLCDRVVVLHHGRVAFDGPSEQALGHYARLMAAGRGGPAASESVAAAPGGDGRARVTDVRLDVPGHDPAQPVPSGAKARLEVEVTAAADLVGQGGLTVGMAVRRPDLPAAVYETRTSWRGTYVAPPPPGERLRATFDFELNVLTGTYLIDLLVGNAETDAVHERRLGAAEVVVHAEPSEAGVTPLNARVGLDNPEGVWPPGSVPPPQEEGGPRPHRKRDGPSPA
ncbi:MAG TPA: ABC transporter ATP-binding protein [Egibacteraceae bacterium]|nr:ABC transporter ATP-binding protein [Egibacteraceae bacterium]